MIRLSATYAAVLLAFLGLAWMVLPSEDSGRGQPLDALSPTPPIVTPVTVESLLRGSVPTEAVSEALPVEGEGGTASARLSAPSTTTPEPLLLQAPSLTDERTNESALTEAEVYALLAESPWPERLWDQVVAISWCESRWTPDEDGDGGESTGLMQVHVPAQPRIARTFDLTDGRSNLIAAYIVYLEAGSSFWPWSCA